VENLVVGAYGWNQSGWLESFYPEDMPEDWRLDYYSQFFQAVLVPESEWQSWANDDIGDLAEALEDETFYFVFEVQGTLDAVNGERLRYLKAHLGNQAYGLLCHGEAQGVAAEGFRVTHVSDNVLPDSVGGWSWQYDGLFLWGEPMGYVATLSEDGKQQADMLKQFMASLPEGREGALFLIGSPKLDIAQLKSLKVVGELLGF